MPVQLTVEHLMAAAKQLSPSERREFIQHLTAWQQQGGQQAEEESALPAAIEEHSRLPTEVQRRYEQLRFLPTQP